MKPDYNDLLPSYLDGPVIQRHGIVLDESTEYLYDQLGLLESWNNLTRPVLIQKEQVNDKSVTYTVHVHLPYAIKSIRINGDYNTFIEYSEDDLVTDTSIPFTLTFSDLYEKHYFVYVTRILNADLLVEVETYEGYTYTKGYPENDTVQDNSYDHDSLLDTLGTVLTIPRRQYDKYDRLELYLGSTTPSWFGKEYKEREILATTEDDYYYSQRLQQFIQDFMVDGLSLEKSKLRAVYNANVTEEINYNDLICHMDVDNMDEKEMAENDTREANTYVYKVGLPEYINLPGPGFDGLSEFIRSFVSVTKNVLVVEDYTVQVELLEELEEQYYEDDVVSIPIRVTTSGGKPIPGIRVRAGWISNRSTGYTDENGIFTYEKTLKYSSSAVAFDVDVYDMTPYTGTSVEYPSSIIEQEVIPITMDLYVVSSDTSGVTLGVDFFDEDEQPFTCDANITLIYNQYTWQTSMIDDNTVNVSSSGLSFVQGSTYTFRVSSKINTHAPRGYKYTAQTETIDVKIGSGELIPVTLDTTVTTVSKTKISVDVEFLNTTTGNSISLNGTITLTIDYGPGSPQQHLDTKTLSNESSVTLENGSGFIFPDGTHTLIIRLEATNPPAGYYYDNSITATETITIISKTSIDCTTTNAWVRNNERVTTTAVLDNDGYITSDRGGSDYYTVCNDLILQKGMTIEIDFMMKNSGTHGYGLEQVVSNSPNKFFVFNGTMEEKHSGGTQTTQSVATIPTNTLTTIKYEIDTDGYITLTDSNGAHTSNTAFTDSELSLMQFCWKHGGSDKSYSVRRLEHYGGEEYDLTYEWADSLTNWKNTSNGTYTPSLTTQEGLVGVKSPQGSVNMSFHMNYLDVPIRLDETTVIRCEAMLGGLQNISIMGMFTKNLTNSSYQFRTWGSIVITSGGRNFENLDGQNVSISPPALNSWYPLFFVIRNREVTAIFPDAQGNVNSYTTTINNVSSDDTKNNVCYLGINSGASSYPLTALRCIRIVRFNSSNQS